ncbi:MAG: hypothetical protein IJV65_00865 [Kiritimatiellae bacterium]|nr:hypothetical protein [Kiritimatiellia bacterium]
MRGRAWSTLLVMFVGVALAAALQELCPPLGAVRVKPPLLLGAAVYYAMRREAVWGALAALWCGAVENGLGPVPGGVPLLFFALAWALCFHAVRPQVEEGARSCALAGAALAPALQLADWAALRVSGAGAAVPLSFLAGRLLVSALAGGLAAFAAGLFLRGLDWISANVGLEEEGDAFGWTGD